MDTTLPYDEWIAAKEELKWVAEGMKAYPWLRKTAINLANQIHDFPLAATVPH